MWYITDGRIKFAVYYSLVLATLVVLWGIVPGIFSATEVLITGVLLGLGLGADVVGATIARFHLLADWSNRCMWAFRTAASHTMIALVGLFSCVALASWSSHIGTIIRVLGLIAILGLLIQEGLEQRNAPQGHSTDEASDSSTHSSTVLRPRDWGLVLAVSIDAAISMPVQSSLMIEWKFSQVLSAMLLVGAVVGLCAIAGALVASAVTRSAQRTLRVKQLERGGYLFEVLIMSYIGWRGILPLFMHERNVATAAGVSALLTMAALALFSLSKPKTCNAVSSG